MARRATTSTAALLAGLPATAVGAGLAVRHLQKVGPTPTAVVGLVLLVAGLLLLGFTWRSAWQATRTWWRLWLVPATLVGLALIWAVMLAVMLTVVPRVGLGDATPADRGLPYRDVTFRTDDGATLAGWFVPGDNAAAVVAVPGAGSTRNAVLAQTAVLADHGYAVLAVDPRGQGRSTGRGMDLGWWGERDISAAVDFLVRQPGVDPRRVAVLGLSMGGEEAIGAAGADPRIAAVVAEGATGRTAEDKDGWLPHGVLGVIQRGVDELTYDLVELLTPAPKPQTLRDAVEAASGTTFLLITAGEVPDEADAAAWLRGGTAGRVDVWEVPGAGHTRGLATRPAEWERRVTALFDAAIGGR
jgi:dienelactone hydrolase